MFNQAADVLSQAALPGEWRLHPQAVQLIWNRFICFHLQKPPIASGSTPYPRQHSARMLWHTAGPRACTNMRSPSEPTSTDTVQGQGGQGSGPVSGSILAQQDLVPGTHTPRDSPSLADSSEEGSAFSEMGHPLAPVSRLLEIPCVVPGWDVEVLDDLSQEVALTIASPRGPSTRRTYAVKWNLFVEWCSSYREDPRRCSIRAVLSFLQQGLEHRLPS